MKGHAIANKANAECEPFRGGALAYAAYLDTPEGRLRSRMTFANLQEFLPTIQPPRCLRALDIGAGTGAAAMSLARIGVHVALLDSSAEMLDFANSAAQQAGVGNKVALREGDASQVASLFRGECFDLILCHNVLEFMVDPSAILHSVSELMRESSILSVVVRTQAGEVLKATIQTVDLAGAERNLTADWGRESLFGGRVRLFTPESVRAILSEAPITMTAARGVRAISDYLPPAISLETEYEQIFELERKLGSRLEFLAIARDAQFLARRTLAPEPSI